MMVYERMLSGTDLNFAYSRDVPSPSNKQSTSNLDRVQEPEKRVAPQPDNVPIPMPSSLDSPLMTPDEKVFLLSAELKRHREMSQNTATNSQPGYIDKMWGKKRDVMKLFMIALVFMSALSLHWVAKHYMNDYLETNVMSQTKELVFRLLYPLSVLFVLWNMRVFSK